MHSRTARKLYQPLQHLTVSPGRIRWKDPDLGFGGLGLRVSEDYRSFMDLHTAEVGANCRLGTKIRWERKTARVTKVA